MADALEIQAKSDRELLIMAIDKINTMDEKIDSVCGNISDHDDDLKKLEVKTKVLEDRSDTQKTINLSILVAGIGFIANAILSWFKVRI